MTKVVPNGGESPDRVSPRWTYDGWGRKRLKGYATNVEQDKRGYHKHQAELKGGPAGSCLVCSMAEVEQRMKGETTDAPKKGDQWDRAL